MSAQQISTIDLFGYLFFNLPTLSLNHKCLVLASPMLVSHGFMMALLSVFLSLFFEVLRGVEPDLCQQICPDACLWKISRWMSGWEVHLKLMWRCWWTNRFISVVLCLASRGRWKHHVHLSASVVETGIQQKPAEQTLSLLCFVLVFFSVLFCSGGVWRPFGFLSIFFGACNQVWRSVVKHQPVQPVRSGRTGGVRTAVITF